MIVFWHPSKNECFLQGGKFARDNAKNALRASIGKFADGSADVSLYTGGWGVIIVRFANVAKAVAWVRKWAGMPVTRECPRYTRDGVCCDDLWGYWYANASIVDKGQDYFEFKDNICTFKTK